MPVTTQQLSKRLIIAAKARREIRLTTLSLKVLGKKIIRARNENNRLEQSTVTQVRETIKKLGVPDDIAQMLSVIYKDSEKAVDWLNAPIPALNNVSPINTMDLKGGANAVMLILRKIDLEGFP